MPRRYRYKRRKRRKQGMRKVKRSQLKEERRKHTDLALLDPESEKEDIEPITREARLLLSFKHSFDNRKLGYGGKDYNLGIGEPFEITKDEFDELNRFGNIFSEMLTISHQLYEDSLGNPNLVTRLVESGLSDKAIHFQRSMYEGKLVVPPLFFRADMISLDTAVELNIPGGGLGLMESIQKVCAPHNTFGQGLAKGMAQALKERTGSDQPRVYFPIHNDNVGNHVRYFVRVLRSFGVRAKTYKYGDDLPDPDEFDLLVPVSFNTMVKKDNWDEVWDAYVTGGVQIDPLPTSMHQSKIPEVLMYHPETKDYFSDEMRSLFPETYLVEQGLEVVVDEKTGEKIPIEELSDQPKRMREFVLKYAGSESTRSGAGKAVYQLDGKRRGKDGAEDLIFDAIVKWQEKGEAWLIQPRLKVKHDIGYLDLQTHEVVRGNMRARIMPYYARIGNGVELVGGSALFNRSWKVHGNRSSIHCAVKAVDKLND